MKFLINLLFISYSFSAYVYVNPRFQSDCTTPWYSEDDNQTAIDINEALSLLQPNSALVLNEGCHEIVNFSLVQNLFNITITGICNNVTITCSDGLGLAFANITNLNIFNVTIDDCGFQSNQTYFQKILTTVTESIDIFYNIPIDSQVGSIFADITHFQMKSVNVVNTQGLGIMAINIIGTSFLQDTLFENNKASTYGTPYQRFCSNTGGGMFLFYDDYTDPNMKVDATRMSIVNSTFNENDNCGYGFLFTQPDSIKLAGLTYNVTYSSGLAISLAQLTYPVRISIIGSKFTNNSGYVAGLGLTVFQGVHDLQLTVENCTFEANDLAIGMQTNALQPTKNAQLILAMLGNTTVNTNTIMIKKTNIFNSHLGVYMLAFQPLLASYEKQDLLLIEECTLSMASSAIIARSLQCRGFLPGILIHLNDIQVHNIYIKSGIYFVEAGAIQCMSLNVTISGVSTISSCEVPGVFASNTIINVNGTLSFTNNSATIGGAMYLHNSHIVVYNNSALRFVCNSATLKGGGIFADLQPIGKEGYLLPDSYYGTCFISFEKLDQYYEILMSRPNLESLNVSIEFINNTAPLGNSIYGSSLRLCTWMPKYNESNMFEVFQKLPLFFTPSINTSNVISTEANKIVITNSSLSAVPGQNVKLNVTAYDDLNQSIPWVISSMSNDHTNTNVSSHLGLSGYWLLPGNNKTLTKAYFNGLENSTSEFLLFGAINSYPRVKFNVNFTNCTVGFIFDDGKCVCDREIDHFQQIKCHDNLFAIEVPAGYWFGETPKLGYIYQQCSLDYCNTNTSMVTKSVDDAQCNSDYQRSGLVCGECKSNYSVVFGSNRCLKCSNAYLATIPVYLLAGIMLVFVITYLNITVADGYINGVIFFCNIISVYQPFFTKSLKSKQYSYIFIPTSFVNMDIGIELCFYNGMTALARSALNLAFPLYLFILMLAITIVAKFSVKLSNISNSVPRSFATIFLLSFTNVGQTCVQIISYFQITGTTHVYYGWYIAPNINYLDSRHLVLTVIATLILIAMLVVAVFLLVPPLVRRLRLQAKLLPLLDPFWNPFKPKYQFWLSMRLFIRIMAFIFAYFIPYPLNCFFLGLLCIILMKIHSDVFHPFKGNAQNRIDQSFIVCLVIMAFSTVFNGLAVSGGNNNITQVYVITVIITMVLAYIGFVGVFMIHMVLRFHRFASFVDKVKEKIKEIFLPGKKKLILTQESEPVPTPQTEVLTTSVYINTSSLREPLLEHLDDTF